jgi:tetratricopeptide (TPR) repeat protein
VQNNHYRNSVLLVKNNLQQNNVNEALKVLNKTEKKYGNNPELCFLFGQAYSVSHNLPLAIKYYRESLNYFKNNADLHNTLANVYKKDNQIEQAIIYYQLAISLEPKEVKFSANLGYAYIRKGENNLAIDLFEKILSNNTHHQNSQLGLSLALSALDKDDEAIDVLLLLLDTHPDNFLAQYNIGLSYKKVFKFESALAAFIKALKLNNNRYEVYENIGYAYLELNRCIQAQEIFESGLKKYPYSSQLNSAYANLLWQVDHKDFLSHYASLSLELMDINLVCDYIYKLIKANLIENAATKIAYFQRKFGDSESFCLLKYSYLHEIKDYKTAHQLLKARSSQKKLSFFELDWLGRTLLMLGEFKEAAKVYKELTEQQPLNQGYWCLYSSALREIDDNAYQYLCNYDELIFEIDIEPPSHYQSIELFNADLLSAIESVHVTKKEPLDQTVIGGTQTLSRIFEQGEPVFKEVEALFKHAFKTSICNINSEKSHPTNSIVSNDLSFSGAWSIWIKSNGFHKNHYHSQGWYSGVYYVTAPHEDELLNNAGNLKIGEPDLAIPSKHNPELYIKPKAGRLVLFPSFMWHGTVPFTSNDPRVSIAFDVIPRN